MNLNASAPAFKSAKEVYEAAFKAAQKDVIAAQIRAGTYNPNDLPQTLPRILADSGSYDDK